MSLSEVCVCPWLFMSLCTHPEVREQVCNECMGGNLCASHTYPCSYGALCVCIPASGCPYRSLYIGTHVFLYISIIAYAHILFRWYVFGYRSMFFSVVCLSMLLFVSGHTGHHVARQHGPCVYMLGPSLTSSVSCHVYLLGFNPRSALC